MHIIRQNLRVFSGSHRFEPSCMRIYLLPRRGNFQYSSTVPKMLTNTDGDLQKQRVKQGLPQGGIGCSLHPIWLRGETIPPLTWLHYNQGRKGRGECIHHSGGIDFEYISCFCQACAHSRLTKAEHFLKLHCCGGISATGEWLLL